MYISPVWIIIHNILNAQLNKTLVLTFKCIY